MSQLEQAAIPILEPLILGHALQLSIEDQRLLATWSIKTSLTLNEHRKDDPAKLPTELYRDICKRRTPASDHRVYAAAVADEPGLLRWEAIALLADGDVFGYISFILIGRIVLRVVGAERPVEPLDRTYYKRFWPSDAALSWPPATIIPRPLVWSEAPPAGTAGYPTAWPKPVETSPVMEMTPE